MGIVRPATYACRSGDICNNQDAMSFGFRLRFRIPEGQRLICSEHSLEHSFLLDRDYSLCPSFNLSRVSDTSSDKRLDETCDLSITASGYLTPDEASHAGSRMLAALRLAQLLLGTGVDAGPSKEIGTGRSTLQTSQAELDRIASLVGLGANSFIDDQPGVSIFCGTKPQFSPLRFHAKVTTRTPLSRLVKAIVHADSIIANQGGRFSLACELYNSSHFEASLRARFLTLMTSVEVLADGEEVPEGNHVKKRKANALIKRVIPDRFRNQYYDRRKRCYKARCDLVHTGKTEESLGSLLVDLDRLVRALIIHESRASVDYLHWDR